MKKLWASGEIEDTYVRGAYDSNVVKVQVLSRPPLSKLHGSRSCTRCCIMCKKLRSEKNKVNFTQIKLLSVTTV